MTNEPIIIDTPDAMAHFRMASIIAMLTIEVETGMVHSRGSALAAAKRTYGIKAHTKSIALKRMLDLYEETYGRKYGA